jgi:hypothetical protein
MVKLLRLNLEAKFSKRETMMPTEWSRGNQLSFLYAYYVIPAFYYYFRIIVKIPIMK